ncbi:6-O-methylguanine DNA methyltransferase DNA binding domain protein [Mycoplasma sp. CAG:776]|nr:6-O-methylguanine DNA methyltransferase DNA binding domain protein [Mycoplasma sp. CAG:776]
MKYLKTYTSPLGLIYMSSDGEYLTGLWFSKSRDEKKHHDEYQEKDLKIFVETEKWLDLYFQGRNPDFTPKYKIEGTPFRLAVSKIMCRIPYGSVVTYQDIANELAKMKGIAKMSAQAVGGAVGWNPICLIVPCHRVVGKNGSLTGYGGGIQNKVKLLELEGIDMSKYFVPKKGTAL